MMPLSFMSSGDKAVVRKVGGGAQTRNHLADLGFVADTELSIIQAQDGNMIVGVKDARVAITKEMASHIMVE